MIVCTIMSINLRVAVTGSVCMDVLMPMAMSLPMGVVRLMSMGVRMVSIIAMDMRMLVSMSRVMGVLMLMSMGVGMTSAIGMNMLMLMVVRVSPVMGMIMAMVMGVAVMRADGVNMVMIVMVTGVGLDIKQGRLGAVAASAMPAHQAASSSSMVLIKSSLPASRSVWRDSQGHGA
jgi:hypothetical protein